MSGAAGSSQWMYATGYDIDQSLRFEDGSAPELTRTFPSAGNRKTWTWSSWIKRGNISDDASSQYDYNNIFAQDNTYISFSGDDKDAIRIFSHDGSTRLSLITTQFFRDHASWYHLMFVLDTTQSTASNRAKLYINGVRVTEFGTETYPDQNYDIDINTADAHSIGGPNQNYFDGYMADVNFIDGTALTPASFGETGDYGEWKPIEYSGSYGTNGFYLPFEQGGSEGFSTVTWKGDGIANQYIGGVGFKPDFVWIKDNDGGNSHHLFDSVRGAGERLRSDSTAAEDTVNSHTAFNNDGFTLGASGTGISVSGNKHVAWNWDMGGSNANNTTGSTNSVVRASTTYGQSIVTYTGQSGAQTVGHGLGGVPEMYWVKNRSNADEWRVYHKGLNGGTNPEQYSLRLDTPDAQQDRTDWNDTAPTSTVFSVGDSQVVNSGHGNSYVAYCFRSITGYSLIGSFTGNGDSRSTAITITCGFKPQFILMKIIDASSNRDWYIWDDIRSNPPAKHARPDINNADGGEAGKITFTSTGVDITTNDDELNADGKITVYMVFADKREFAYYSDRSGNGNDFTSANLTESDIVLDTPSNNFPTLNPLSRPAFGDGDARTKATLTEGNLKFDTVASQTTYLAAAASIDLGSSGKWYAEFFAETVAGNGSLALGITFDYQLNWYLAHQPGEDDNTWGYNSAGSVTNNNSAVSGTYASYTAGDIIQLAVDLDNDKFYVGKNNTWQEQDPANGNGISISTYAGQMCMITCGATNANQKAGIWNFGQDSSFAGRKVPQANGDYDFFYAPPTGYQAICTKELPEVIKPKENFNVLTYDGTGSSNAQTAPGITGGVDFLWTKCRSHDSKQHILVDDIRGGNNNLMSDSSEAENSNANRSITLGDNSFTLNSDSGHLNESGKTYVSWMWKANGSGSSNTTGDINSTVSANAAAGFSIVSYTGNGSANQTVGHGLSKAPEWILVKNRADDDNWCVFVNSSTDTNLNNTSDATDFLRLDANNATGDDADRWNDTVPTTSVFTVDTDNQVNGSGNAMIAYCFHDVDGYARVGTYRGTGNAAGAPFVHCGFRPAFIIVKQVSGAGDWYMYDQEREGYNPNNDPLVANSANDEGTDDNIDILSNGFRLLNTNTEHNASGQRFFFYAVAEFPLKFTNAK